MFDIRVGQKTVSLNANATTLCTANQLKIILKGMCNHYESWLAMKSVINLLY